MGGLLAFIVVYQPQFLLKYYRLLCISGIAGISVIIVCWLINVYPANTRFIHAVITTWVIGHIIVYKERKSVMISLLSNKLLISIGKVSYGIYLYHILYVYAANRVWYKYIYPLYSSGIDSRYEPWIFTLVNFVILYFISLLSWKVVEKPFLALKRKFEYRGKIRTQTLERKLFDRIQ